MRLTLLLLLFCSFSSAHAGEWEERIDNYIEAYDRSKSNPKPVAYPKLSERVKNVFLPNKRNKIEITLIENGKLIILTEIYYRSGELHILQHKSGWNMLTKGSYVYEWKFGELSGIKIKKNEKELVDYILYLTDPSFIMTSLYNDINNKPENYKVLKTEGEPWSRFLPKNPRDGFEEIFVDESSLWFYGFKVTRPKSGLKFSLYCSRPAEYEKLPKELTEALDKVRFDDSNKLVKRHMVYL